MSIQPPVGRSPMETAKDPDARPKITSIGSASAVSVESQWKRPPKCTGGATHVRTFTGKMNSAGLEHLDRHINEWLDNHPDAEVKFSTVTSGEMGTSIGKESVIVVQVWV